MSRLLKIEENETEIILNVPARQQPVIVAISTLVVLSGLWFGAEFFYLCLAKSEEAWSFRYIVFFYLLFIVTLFSARTLIRQLVTRTITLERHVIGIKQRLLGVPLRQQWVSIYRIERWLIQKTFYESRVSVGFTISPGRAMRPKKIFWIMDEEQWLNLLVRMQRKEFPYT